MADKKVPTHFFGEAPTEPGSVMVMRPKKTLRETYESIVVFRDGKGICHGLSGEGCQSAISMFDNAFSNVHKHLKTCPHVRHLLTIEDGCPVAEIYKANMARVAPVVGGGAAGGAGTSNPFAKAAKAAQGPANKELSQDKLTTAVSKVVAHGLFPFEFVANPAVGVLLGDLGFTNVHMPHPTTVARHVKEKLWPQELDRVRSLLLRELSNKKTWYYLTFDGWSSSAKGQYLGVTIHYFSEQWVKRDFPIAIQPFPGTHDGPAIYKAVEKSLQLHAGAEEVDKHLPKETRRGVVADGAANCQAAYDDEDNVLQTTCFSHTALRTLDDADQDPTFHSCVEASKAVVLVFSSSPTRLSVLQKYQDEYKKSHAGYVATKLQLPPSHRWNYEHIMLKRLLRQWPIIKVIPAEQLFSKNSERTNYMNLREEFEQLMPIIDELIPLLESFASWTEFMSSRGTTLGYTLLALRKLKKAAEALSKSANPLVKTLGAKVEKSLKDRFDTWLESPTFLLAEALEPSRAVYIPAADILERIMALEGDELLLPAEVCAVPAAAKKKAAGKKGGAAAAMDDDSDTEVSPHLASSASPTKSKIQLEVDRYAMHLADIARLPVKEQRSVDAATFYKSKPDLPYIGNIARNVLPLPGSSAESERAFASGGKVCSKARGSLSPESVEMLTLMYLWNKKGLSHIPPPLAKEDIEFEADPEHDISEEMSDEMQQTVSAALDGKDMDTFLASTTMSLVVQGAVRAQVYEEAGYDPTKPDAASGGAGGAAASSAAVGGAKRKSSAPAQEAAAASGGAGASATGGDGAQAAGTGSKGKRVRKETGDDEGE